MPLNSDTARRMLDHLNGRAVLTIAGPLKLHIRGLSQNVSYTHDVPQVIALTAATRAEWNTDPDASWVATNQTTILFPNLPAMSVTHWFITDSSPTPVVVWEGQAVRVREVPAGDSYEVPAGALKVQLVDVLDS